MYSSSSRSFSIECDRPSFQQHSSLSLSCYIRPKSLFPTRKHNSTWIPIPSQLHSGTAASLSASVLQRIVQDISPAIQVKYLSLSHDFIRFYQSLVLSFELTGSLSTWEPWTWWEWKRVWLLFVTFLWLVAQLVLFRCCDIGESWEDISMYACCPPLWRVDGCEQLGESGRGVVSLVDCSLCSFRRATMVHWFECFWYYFEIGARDWWVHLI